MEALTVKDIGDSNLYAVLASLFDNSGNNGGVLYKEDAENFTSIHLASSSIYENVSKICW